MTDAPSWAHRGATWLHDHPGSVLAAVLLLMALAAVPASQVRVDTAVQHWFTEGDPALERYRAFQETYGNDEGVLLGLQRSEGLLTPEGLSRLRTATDRVEAVDGVADVTSLTTQSRVQTTLAGPQLVPLVPSGTLSTGQARSLRNRVRQDLVYARLVSADGTMAAVYARMKRNSVADLSITLLYPYTLAYAAYLGLIGAERLRSFPHAVSTGRILLDSSLKSSGMLLGPLLIVTGLDLRALLLGGGLVACVMLTVLLYLQRPDTFEDARSPFRVQVHRALLVAVTSSLGLPLFGGSSVLFREGGGMESRFTDP